MLNFEILSPGIPVLHLEDSVMLAKDSMMDHRVSHLPVVADNILLGCVTEDNLLDAKDDSKLIELQASFSRAAVQGDNHILETLHICSEFQLSLIPVLNHETEYVGSITAQDLLRNTAKLIGSGEPGAIIVLEMDKVDFAFSEIVKLVETNDAQITQLNTYFDADAKTFYITLRINRLEISDIVATFQRYEFKIKYYFGEEHYENELRSNYNHLMNYLSI